MFPTNEWRQNMNPLFKKHADHIEVHLKDRDSEKHATKNLCHKEHIDNYRIAPYKTLYEKCVAHALCYNSKHPKELSIVLVHPFYLFLTDLKELENPSAAKIYLGRLEQLLDNKPKEAEIVVFETAHHYAAYTHRLLEEKTIDRIAFTAFDTSYAMDLHEIVRLKGKEVYVGGAYNRACLSDFLKQLSSVNEDFHILPEIILDNPARKNILDPVVVINEYKEAWGRNRLTQRTVENIAKIKDICKI